MSVEWINPEPIPTPSSGYNALNYTEQGGTVTHIGGSKREPMLKGSLFPLIRYSIRMQARQRRLQVSKTTSTICL